MVMRDSNHPISNFEGIVQDAIGIYSCQFSAFSGQQEEIRGQDAPLWNPLSQVSFTDFHWARDKSEVKSNNVSCSWQRLS